MSWQGYVDTSLIGTGKIDKAAIFSAAGDSVWAVSTGFAAKPEEIKNIVNGWTNPGPLYANGLHVNGEKYLCIKADERSIYGRLGKQGICCVKTKQAILVAHYPENVQSGEAAKVVEALADYLISVGY
ncbi:Profilin, actin-and phosphatidylinositol 4,5-bisphosphate-binding protein [Terfezia boudieri ATCC MYA-4762]|uniref:Profilin n=1 Tax=Terfezia boudieri ATCC MYA-4762 TaxID=1051890 RepID=A0A3N4LS84_9PEZI|nr:Profilin, actin-and phosphatidylinositol 4,5-bisphosphate-binding protein [Terfezia boudieri ATCC MYA-4762]